MQTLFVDELNEDASYGFTVNPNSIFHNLGAIKEAYLRSAQKILSGKNTFSSFMTTRRYLCYVSMSLDEADCIMQFIDLGKDDQKAIHFASTFDGDDKARCLAAYETIKSGEFYDKLPDVALVVGAPDVTS